MVLWDLLEVLAHGVLQDGVGVLTFPLGTDKAFQSS